MKKKTIWNRSVALFLSFCMVFGLAVMMPAAALADDGAHAGGEGTAKTRNSAEYDYTIIAIDGNEPANNPPTVIPPVSASENGVLVEAYDDYTAALRITEKGGISVSAGEIGATVNAKDGGTAKLTLDGPLISGDIALDVSASDKGTAVLKTGDLTTNDGGDGVAVEATGEGVVDIETGIITAKGTGVSVSADDGANVKVQAGGAVNAENDGVFVLADGKGTQVAVYSMQEVNAVHEGVEIEASEGAYAGGMIGSVKSSGENAFGVWLKTDDPSSYQAAAAMPDKLSSISIYSDAEEGSAWHTMLGQAGSSGSSAKVALDTGDVQAYAGIHVEAKGGVAGIETGKVTVTEGNIKDDEKPVEDRFANGFIATDGGMVVGDLDSVQSAACGVDLYIRSGGAATVNTGKIEADQIGVHIDNEGGKTWTDVETVTSKMEAIGITLVGDDSVSFVFADGNLTSTGGDAIHIDNYGGHTLVAIAGDATSTAANPNLEKQAGLDFNGSGETQVLVVGTLSGANGVKIEEGSKSEDLDLTVWTIKANNGDIIAGDDAESFAKSVSYIVMTEQPIAGGKLTACKKNGDPLDRKYGDSDQLGFEVAYEDQLVLLKVDPDEGYKVVAAYNGMEDRVKIERAADGYYYLKVDRGGGIYLTVELKLIPAPAPSPSGKTKKTSSRALIQLVVEEAEDGKEAVVEEYRVAVGEIFTFPEAPEREGYRFLCWQDLNDPDVRYNPGDGIVITGNEAFAAVWEKI